LEGTDQVIQNTVGNGFMEGPFIAVGPEVELEGFKLHTEFVRDIADLDRGKIWLPCLGTEAGELRAVEPDFIVPVWLGIRESL
jgi:hypothetical protein